MPIVIDPPESPQLEPPLDDGSNLWELLYQELGFHVDDDVHGVLQGFCIGWCAPAQSIYDLVRERDDGTPSWGILWDVDRCPAEQLPYLAQCVGVVVTPEMTEEQIRNEIREPTGWARGREPAIRIAIQRTLDSLVQGEEKRVIIRSRTPAVGEHYIRVLKSQCPDEARSAAVAREKVPAWEVLDFAAIDGVSWADVAAGWDDWSDIAGEFADWADLADILPDELPEP
jgi:hypothetical protein